MSNGKSPFKILGPEIAGLFIAFAVILGVLNYFNILSLSQIYPNLFGWLPQQQKITQKEYPTPTPTLLTSIPCPVDELICSNGRLIATTSGKTTFYALAYTLPPETNLKAVFQGAILQSTSSGTQVEKHPVLSLRKDNKTITIAEYHFFGSAANEWKDSADHEKGLKIFNLSDTIGTIEGQSAFPNKEPTNEANFLFFIKQNEQYYKLKISGDVINLSL